MPVSILLAGVGGQGVLTMAKVLGEAVLSRGESVVMSEVHGLSQRGGSVIVEMRVGARSPLIPRGGADFLISLELIEGLRHAHKLSSRTRGVVSTYRIAPVTVSTGRAKYPDPGEVLEEYRRILGSLVAFDAVALASELGFPLGSNMALLGAATAYEGFPVTVEDLEASIRTRFPPKVAEANIGVLRRGREEALRQLR